MIRLFGNEVRHLLILPHSAPHGKRSVPILRFTLRSAYVLFLLSAYGLLYKEVYMNKDDHGRMASTSILGGLPSIISDRTNPVPGPKESAIGGRWTLVVTRLAKRPKRRVYTISAALRLTGLTHPPPTHTPSTPGTRPMRGLDRLGSGLGR